MNQREKSVLQSKELQEELQFLQKTNLDLRESLEELAVLQDSIKKINSSHSEEEILEEFIKGLCDITGRNACVFLSLESDGRGLEPKFEQNTTHDDIKEKFKIGEDLFSWVLRGAHPVTIFEPRENCGMGGGDELSSLLLVPLHTDEGGIGLLEMMLPGSHSLFTQHDLEKMTFLATQATVSLENAKLYKELSESNRLLAGMKNYMENIFESIHSAIVAIDLEDRITQLNKAAAALLFDNRRKGLVGRRFDKVFPGGLVAPTRKIIHETFVRGPVSDYRMDLHFPPAGRKKAPKGGEIPLSISSSILSGKTENVLGVVLIIRDLSQTREIERLRKIDLMKTEFLSNVSHEFRTPLTSIKAYIETLIDLARSREGADPQTQLDFYNIINTETDRLDVLISDLLDVAAIEAGKMRMVFKNVDLTRVIVDSCKIAQMEKLQSHIEIDLAEGLPPVWGDEDRLLQMMINLVSNAIKYSPRQTRVTVRGRRAPDCDHVLIEVIDQGVGIAPNDLERIFDKFSRVDSSFTAEVRGTGLGLSIVRHIVRSHGGEITVKSKLNRGSTFTVKLPLSHKA